MKVEAWSDVTCPWCGIGHRRLEKALASFEHREHVEVIHRSFELDPSLPPDARRARDFLRDKHAFPTPMPYLDVMFITLGKVLSKRGG
jgi:predicted DsbA family dithiol-disulfide isomerase